MPGLYEMELSSGRYFDVLHPDPSQIRVEDIAHHLARINRYTGAARRPMSVAEHAVLVADRLRVTGASRQQQLCGLHHDDAEAFVGDVGRPLKLALGEAYSRIEQRVEGAIWRSLQLHSAGPAVKEADNWALAAEAWYLLPSRGEGWICWGLFDPNDPDNPPSLGRLRDGGDTPPHLAAALFLDWHYVLTTQVNGKGST